MPGRRKPRIRFGRHGDALRKSATEIRGIPRVSAAPKGARDRAREPASSSGPSERVIPDHIRKRFVQVGHRYYFSDGAHAFTDRGTRLVTPSENTEVVKSLIAIAEARGWAARSRSTGSERFRKEAWAAASALGLKVRGYTPTEFERAHLARKLAREAAPSPEVASQSAPRGTGPQHRSPARPRSAQGSHHRAAHRSWRRPPIGTTPTSRSPISSRSKLRKVSVRSGAWT